MKEYIEYGVFFGLLAFTGVCVLRYKPAEEEVQSVELIEYNKCESPIERRLYNGLVSYGLQPRTQWPAGRRYRIDLAFPGRMIAIEADGKAYHSTPAQKAHDRKKDRYLRSKGWTVLRFSGSRIHRNLPSVVRRISDELSDEGT
ncbi:endonuclease domain-containing protein [Halobacillus seohaensis]|uniref:Endonuclease domain-containing protein n=1 Tax=Halobacillus seohaensis TaxID=447421 RepID=A0ABW2EP43_9BACI